MINLWLLYLLLWQHCTRNKNTSMLYIHSCAKCLKDEFNDKEICFLSNEEIHSDHMDFQWWFTFTVGYSRTLLVQTPDDMYWKSTCKHGYNMTMEIVWLKFTDLYSRYYGLTLYTILLMCMYIITSGLILLDLIGPDSRWHGLKKVTIQFSGIYKYMYVHDYLWKRSDVLLSVWT